MPVIKMLDASAARQSLSEACLRNLRADVECLQGGRIVRRFSTRMLRYWPGTLLVECPTEHGLNRPPDPDCGVVLHFQLDGQRLSVDGLVGRTVRFALSGTARVTALQIERLGTVRHNQRRDRYRLRVIGIGPIPVLMSFVAGRAPADGPTEVKGTMINISEGGLAVTCSQKQTAALVREEELNVRFSLPDVERPFLWRARLVHHRAVESSAKRILGLMFLDSLTERGTQQETERIHHFVVGQERRKMRRKR